MSAISLPLTEISGTFYRAIPPERVESVLDPPHATSAGRYHRPGQPALYMSPHLEWARIAVSGYMREDAKPRVVVPVRVERASVFDQRDPTACQAIGLDPVRSNRSWRQALQRGETPPSWFNSDRVRQGAADGLIDVSRHIEAGWHLVLFTWNEPGGPCVSVAGQAVPVYPTSDGPKWG